LQPLSLFGEGAESSSQPWRKASLILLFFQRSESSFSQRCRLGAPSSRLPKAILLSPVFWPEGHSGAERGLIPVSRDGCDKSKLPVLLPHPHYPTSARPHRAGEQAVSGGASPKTRFCHSAQPLAAPVVAWLLLE